MHQYRVSSRMCAHIRECGHKYSRLPAFTATRTMLADAVQHSATYSCSCSCGTITATSRNASTRTAGYRAALLLVSLNITPPASTNQWCLLKDQTNNSESTHARNHTHPVVASTQHSSLLHTQPHECNQQVHGSEPSVSIHCCHTCVHRCDINHMAQLKTTALLCLALWCHSTTLCCKWIISSPYQLSSDKCRQSLRPDGKGPRTARLEWSPSCCIRVPLSRQQQHTPSWQQGSILATHIPPGNHQLTLAG